MLPFTANTAVEKPNKLSTVGSNSDKYKTSSACDQIGFRIGRKFRNVYVLADLV